MTMQNNIDIIWRHIRRNMFQPKSQTAANKIDNQRPLGIAVAIPAHNRDRWADPAQFVQNDFRAHIAQMPDLVRVARKIDNFLWQLVMSVRQNKNSHLMRGGSASPKTMLSIGGLRPRRINIALGTTRSTFKAYRLHPTICSLASNRVI